MRKLATLGFCFLATAAVVVAALPEFHEVKPIQFDPSKSQLVGAGWIEGIGCATDASYFDYYTNANATYTDPACLTGDIKDKKNEGLLLSKVGPLGNFAEAGAELKNVKGMAVTELGYDIRKPSSADDGRGSHCGAGSPRFQVRSGANVYYVGCTSPLANSVVAGTGFQRLRWGGSSSLMGYDAYTFVLTDITGIIADAIFIEFDDSNEVGPDNFGAAILDNIALNGTLIGRGPAK